MHMIPAGLNMSSAHTVYRPPSTFTSSGGGANFAGNEIQMPVLP